jgi:hypothetical protein
MGEIPKFRRICSPFSSSNYKTRIRGWKIKFYLPPCLTSFLAALILRPWIWGDVLPRTVGVSDVHAVTTQNTALFVGVIKCSEIEAEVRQARLTDIGPKRSRNSQAPAALEFKHVHNEFLFLVSRYLVNTFSGSLHNKHSTFCDLRQLNFLLKEFPYLFATQNYWVFGLCSSSGILKTRKHNVSETGSVSVLRWTGRHLFCWAPSNHWTGVHISCLYPGRYEIHNNETLRKMFLLPSSRKIKIRLLN